MTDHERRVYTDKIRKLEAEVKLLHPDRDALATVVRAAKAWNDDRVSPPSVSDIYAAVQRLDVVG